ncbi:hypothetical protein PISMIDRAFT_677835 [Pisolithus microcarpus 441]|uniref:Uncharacterized protein n=1 Tax=Pisolithus microcarpus 441 TaxID=765257 RepID=A0A0C9ZYE3_9AGAM|nr:hypothetical protein PISMIDRAFT_677835 [Pisolithus microcarpus 441]
MPHPSSPLDDIRTRSFDREHGLTFGGTSRTFGSVFCWAARSLADQSQRAECLSDGFLLSVFYVVKYVA